MKYIDGEEKHLRVYGNKSEYYSGKDFLEIFHEGVVSNEAKKRIKKVKTAFRSGFLDKLICELRDGKIFVEIDKVSAITQESLGLLVDSLTSEVGRALIGLSVMQLCIKSIVPEQSVRLHKGSSNRGSFSWTEGISMRSLDKNYMCGRARSHILAGEMPVPEGWPATG